MEPWNYIIGAIIIVVSELNQAVHASYNVPEWGRGPHLLLYGLSWNPRGADRQQQQQA